MLTVFMMAAAAAHTQHVLVVSPHPSVTDQGIAGMVARHDEDALVVVLPEITEGRSTARTWSWSPGDRLAQHSGPKKHRRHAWRPVDNASSEPIMLLSPPGAPLSRRTRATLSHLGPLGTVTTWTELTDALMARPDACVAHPDASAAFGKRAHVLPAQIAIVDTDLDRVLLWRWRPDQEALVKVLPQVRQDRIRR